MRHWFADMGAAALDPLWTGGAFAVGVVVTLLAAWLPTRATTRVAPLAALRPDTGVDVRSAAGRVRLALAALVWGRRDARGPRWPPTPPLPVMLAGGTVVFVGVLLLGPVLVPALIRLVGRLAGDGPVRRLAVGNAVRNPRRTATTAASLLVGVTLTTAVLTGLASSRTELDKEMDADYPVDVSITAIDGTARRRPGRPRRGRRRRGEAATLDGTMAAIGRSRSPSCARARRGSSVVPTTWSPPTA